MSERRARYVGHPDGVDLNAIPVGTEGETRRAHIQHGGELPSEIDGQKVPASFRDSLLEQKDQWTEVKRATGAEATGKAPSSAKAEEKGADR